LRGRGEKKNLVHGILSAAKRLGKADSSPSALLRVRMTRIVESAVRFAATFVFVFVLCIPTLGAEVMPRVSYTALSDAARKA